MSKLTWDRTFKNQARTLALGSLKGAKQSILMLPGIEAKCVAEAKDNGTITNTTRSIFVERDPEAYPLMQEAVRGLGLNGWFVPSSLHNLELPWKLDYAFLDFCGIVNNATAMWIMDELRPKLAPNAELAFTFSYPLRSNDFMKMLAAETMTDPIAASHLRYLSIRHDILYDKWTERLLFYIYLIEGMLCGYEFDLSLPPITYNDNVIQMLLFCLTNIRPTEPSNDVRRMSDKIMHIVVPYRPRKRIQKPLTVSVADTVDSPLIKRKNPVMVLAGYKAWDTRRRNEKMKGGV